MLIYTINGIMYFQFVKEFSIFYKIFILPYFRYEKNNTGQLEGFIHTAGYSHATSDTSWRIRDATWRRRENG